MKLRAVKIDKKFIPEFNGNKKLSIDEQVVIYFSKIPGTVERSNYNGFKFDQSFGTQLVHNDQMLVSAFIERIENLEDSEGNIIKSGQELAALNDSVLESLFPEIRNYLFPEGEELTEKE